MGKVTISTNTDKKKVQEVALDIEEVYRTGMRYKISEFISAFGGGTNKTPGKDDDFVIPGPYISIELFEDAYSLSTIIVDIWYKEEDIKMDNTQDAEKKIEELRCLIDDLVECNKKLEDEKRMLLQERRQLTAKIMKLDEKAAKEKESKEFEKAYTKGLEDVNDGLRKAIESKENDIQALMDQLDAKDREIEKYKFMVIHMADDLYGKGNLDRGEEDLEDDE